MEILSTAEEIKYLGFLYFNERKTLKEVADIFNCCPNTVKRRLLTYYTNEYNIAKHRNYKNLDLIHNFFEIIDTEEKAYILGFLLADGNVYYSENSYRIRFSIAEQDIEILYKIKDILRLSSEVRIQDRTERGSSQRECMLAWSSEKQFNDLAKYGIVPNKTLKSFLPINYIESNVKHHFIRGFFDGDGCISIKKNGHKECSFVGTERLINELREFLCLELGIYYSKILSRTKVNTVYQIVWGSKGDVNKLFEYMYKDATIYFDRKYKKFLV